MRALGRPEVVKSSAVAAFCTAVASFPRLTTAPQLRYPLWYLEALLFLGGMVLWAFVFAWHAQYSHRPVFVLRADPWPWAAATLAGLACASVLSGWLDPALRLRSPQDYPRDFSEWVAMTLFGLGFTQLFLVFAPFAWLLRLFRRIAPAALLTVLFGVFVFALKNRHSPPMAPQLLLALLAFRVIAGGLAVYLFLRGGVFLVWWWALLLQCRHLLHLGPHG